MDATYEIWNYLYLTFIKEGLFITIACYVFGQILVKCINKIDNNLTVPILSITGAVLVLLIPSIFSDDPMVVRIIKGVILGWASTGFHELIKGVVRLGIIKIPGYELKDNGEG